MSNIIAYHGGPNINTFHKDFIGSAGNGLVFGKAFYFTSDKDMAYDFAIKAPAHGYVYTVAINAASTLKTTNKALNTKVMRFLSDNDDEDIFWNELFSEYDCLAITNRPFGGNSKFPNYYDNFTEYVVKKPSIIKIVKKEAI